MCLETMLLFAFMLAFVTSSDACAVRDALEAAAEALMPAVTYPVTPPAIAPIAPMSGSPPPAIAPLTAPCMVLPAILASFVFFVVAIEVWLLVSVVEIDTTFVSFVSHLAPVFPFVIMPDDAEFATAVFALAAAMVAFVLSRAAVARLLVFVLVVCASTFALVCAVPASRVELECAVSADATPLVLPRFAERTAQW